MHTVSGYLNTVLAFYKFLYRICCKCVCRCAHTEEQHVLVTHISVTCHSGTIVDCSVLCNAEGGLVSRFFPVFFPFAECLHVQQWTFICISNCHMGSPVPYIRMLFLAVTSHIINTVQCPTFSLLREVSIFPCVICDMTLSQTSVGRRRSSL
jgi:hypothetical protein